MRRFIIEIDDEEIANGVSQELLIFLQDFYGEDMKSIRFFEERKNNA